MDKLDYEEHFEKTEDDIRARDVENRKITPPKESGRSVFEIQKQMREKAASQESDEDRQN